MRRAALRARRSGEAERALADADQAAHGRGSGPRLGRARGRGLAVPSPRPHRPRRSLAPSAPHPTTQPQDESDRTSLGRIVLSAPPRYSERARLLVHHSNPVHVSAGPPPSPPPHSILRPTRAPGRGPATRADAGSVLDRPFSLFAVLHCTRIACAYRGGARAGGFDDRLGSEFLRRNPSAGQWQAPSRGAARHVSGPRRARSRAKADEPHRMCDLTDFQAALVPLMLVFGGTTITGMLMGNPPGWLITPVPILTYGYAPPPFLFTRSPSTSSFN